MGMAPRIPGGVVAALPIAFAACADAPARSPAVAFGAPVPVETPAAPGAGQPFVSTTAAGHALLSWIEPAPDTGHLVRFARWSGTAWSEPRTIAHGTDFFVNWADFPSIAELPDGRVAAHWLQRTSPGRYSYGVRVAFSSDGGETWSAPFTPHTDGTHTEHGFVSLFPAAQGLGAVWLDGRNFASDTAGEHGGSSAEMTLRYATVAWDGALSDEKLLDARTCECCQTDAALTSMGPVVVYRDRAQGEVRDIAIVRQIDRGWTDPAIVHADGWVFPGCPVNGPAVAANGDRVAVAWFTAARDTARVRLAFSSDAGASFSRPINIDDGDPAGRVDLLLLDDGSALVSWIERTGDAAAVRARLVSADGVAHAAWTVASASAERAGGFPRMARVDGGVVFAWTEPGRPSHVRTTLVSTDPGS